MNRSLTKIAGALIAILGFVFATNSAFSGYVNNFSYSPDDYRYGSDASANNLYYGGTIFTADSNQAITPDGIETWVCTTATDPETAKIVLLHLLNGVTSNLAEGSSEFTDEGFWYLSVPKCNGGGTTPYPDVIQSGSWSGANGSTEYTFLSGQTYAIVFRGDDVNLTPAQNFSMIQWAPWIIGVSNVVNGYGVELCQQNIFCGANMYAVGGRTAIPAFNLFLTPVTPVLECDITHLYNCFVNAMTFVFSPTEESMTQFATLKDELKDHAPFGYFTSAVISIQGLDASGTPAFVLQQSTPIMSLIFDPLRAGLVWILGFASLIWLYKKLTNIVI